MRDSRSFAAGSIPSELTTHSSRSPTAATSNCSHFSNRTPAIHGKRRSTTAAAWSTFVCAPTISRRTSSRCVARVQRSAYSYPLTRDRPDGYHLSWVLAVPDPPFNGQVPFLIKDDTPRDERVPHERTHRNGTTGIRALAIAVEDPAVTSRYYARVLGRPGAPPQSAGSRGVGRSLHNRSERIAVARVKSRGWPSGQLDSRSRSIALRGRPRKRSRRRDDIGSRTPATRPDQDRLIAL